MNFSHLFQQDDNSIHFSSGDTVIAQGAELDCLYVILKGEAEIHFNDEALADAGPGEVVGELSLIDDEPASASVVALTDLSVTSVDQQRFKTLVQDHPFFALGVMKVMSDRLRRMIQLS